MYNTNTDSLLILAGIAPPDIRRYVASRTERTRQSTGERHQLNGLLVVVPRLKSRKSFIKCTEPINTTAKAARTELWREQLEPMDASVHHNSAADKGHFLVVTPPHLRTSYNLFFLEDGCIGSWKRTVVSVRSMWVVLTIAFVCVLTSNSGVDVARYDFSNISVNIDSTSMHLISKCG